jgi:hypothetical protein
VRRARATLQANGRAGGRSADEAACGCGSRCREHEALRQGAVPAVQRGGTPTGATPSMVVRVRICAGDGTWRLCEGSCRAPGDRPARGCARLAWPLECVYPCWSRGYATRRDAAATWCRWRSRTRACWGPGRSSPAASRRWTCSAEGDGPHSDNPPRGGHRAQARLGRGRVVWPPTGRASWALYDSAVRAPPDAGSGPQTGRCSGGAGFGAGGGAWRPWTRMRSGVERLEGLTFFLAATARPISSCAATGAWPRLLLGAPHYRRARELARSEPKRRGGVGVGGGGPLRAAGWPPSAGGRADDEE